MNARTNTRRAPRTRRPLFAAIASLLLIPTLIAALVAGATAQVTPNALLATQFFDAIGGGTALYVINAGAVLHSPEGNYSGRSGLAQFGDELEASFSDLAFTTNSVEQVDGLTIIRFTMTGVSTGAYHGISANCAGVSAEGVAVLQVSTQTFATDSWVDGAMSQDMDLRQVSTLDVVVEQWIGYDAETLASQVASFNQWAPNTSFGCANHLLPQEAQAADAPPVSPRPSERELPF